MLATSLPVAQWLDRPLVYGRSWVRFPSGTQIFSLSHTRDMLNVPSFLISSPSLKFTIFLYLAPIGHFHIADPSSMRVTTNSVNMTYACHESPSSSVVRASDWCTGGPGFDSRRGLSFFFVPRSRHAEYSIFSYDYDYCYLGSWEGSCVILQDPV